MPLTPATAEHRFFFALLPPPILARQIIEAMTPFSSGERMMAPERLHVTLDILTDFPVWPEHVVAKLQSIGDAVRQAPFDVALDRLAGNDRSMALRPSRANPALNALQRAIATARADAGFQAMRETFSPHLTLSYRKAQPVTAAVMPFRWTVDHVVLIHSHIGRTRHTILGNWPLIAPREGQLSLF